MIIKIVIAALFVACVLYIHFRGKVRARSRQLLDHSSFMAPINVVMYMFSKVPTTPFLDPGKEFPQLEPLRQNWQMIRDEALALRDAQKIAASSTFNDAGFTVLPSWLEALLPEVVRPVAPVGQDAVSEDHGADRVDPGCACGDVRAAAAG